LDKEASGVGGGQVQPVSGIELLGKLEAESFLFQGDLKDATLTFATKSFATFVKFFCTVDTGLSSDIRAKA